MLLGTSGKILSQKFSNQKWQLKNENQRHSVYSVVFSSTFFMTDEDELIDISYKKHVSFFERNIGEGDAWHLEQKGIRMVFCQDTRFDSMTCSTG